MSKENIKAFAEKVRKRANTDVKEKFLGANANLIAGKLKNKLESLQSESQGIYDTYKSRFFDENKKFKNTYRGDTEEAYNTYSNFKTKFDTESQEILSYLDKYGSHLDAESVKNIKAWLTDSGKSYEGILSTYKSDYDTFSPYKSEYDYNASVMNNTSGVDSKSITARQNAYAANNSRIAELDDAIKNFKFENEGSWEWTMNPNSNIPLPSYTVKAKNQAEYDALVAEKQKLEAENRKYKHGNKRNDDTFPKYQSSEDFDTVSEQRDYNHPSTEGIRLIKAAEDSRRNSTFPGDYYTYEYNPDDYIIEDPLGTYLNSTEEDRYWAVSNMNTDNPTVRDYVKTISDGDLGGWEHLNEDEIKLYYYMWNKGLKEEAISYLKGMETELDRRANEKQMEGLENASSFELILHNAASIPANILGGGVAFIEDTLAMLQGEDINPYGGGHAIQNYAQNVRGVTANDINKLTNNAEFLNVSLGDAYQAVMSGMDSIAGAATLGSGYAVLMGMGAASSKAKELYEKGASNTEIALGGLLSGAAEMVFEKISIDHFLKNFINSPATLKNIIPKILAQGGIELTEETATEISNIISDALVMGSQSDWEQTINKYKDLGYSDSEAMSKTLWEIGGTVVESGISGFISGAFMGGGGSIINLAQNKSAENTENKKDGTNIISNENLQNLVAAAENLPNSSANAKIKAVANEVKNIDVSKLSEKEIAALSKKVGKLYSNIQSAQRSMIQTSGRDTLTNIISEKLNENGITDKADIKKATDAIIKDVYSEKELSASESKFLDKVGGDKIASYLRNNEKEILAKVNVAHFQRWGQALETASLTKDKNANVRTIDTDGCTFSDDGETYIKGTDEAVTVTGINSIKDGKMKVNLSNGKTADLSELDLGSEEQAIIYEGVLGMDIDAASAQAIVKGFDFNGNNGISATSYILGMQDAVKYGKIGGKAYLDSGVFTSMLSKKQRENAYRIGEIASENAAKKDTKRVNASIKLNKKGNVTVGKVSFDGISEKDLDIKQKTTVKILEQLFGGRGVNIVFFRSKVVNGKHVGENGSFDSKTNAIRLDINAGIQGNDTILFTAAHELTHFIRLWSHEKFKVFADFLVDSYAKHGIDIDTLVEQQIKKAKSNGREIDYDTAYEEVIADSCETFLRDSKLLDKLIDLAKKDMTLFEKTQLYIATLLDDIRKCYNDYEPDTPEARAVLKWKDSIEKLHSLWEEAALSALGNSQKAGGRIQKNTATEDGVRYSINPDFALKFDAWDKKTVGSQFRIGTTSKVLQDLGVNQRNIYWDTSKIKKIQETHPEMTDEVIKQVPNILEEPILVMESATVPGRLTLFGEVYDSAGVPVLAVLELNPTDKNGHSLNVIKIASAYGKSSNPQGLINKSRILYVDPNKNRTNSWLSANGLQLPKPSSSIGSTNSINQNDSSVNTYSMQESKNNSSNLQQKNTTQEGDVKMQLRGFTRDGRRIYETDFSDDISMDERIKLFKERIATIFNLGAVELKTDVKKIKVEGDKFTEQKNLFGDKKGEAVEYEAKINALYDMADILSTSKYLPDKTDIEPSFSNPNLKPKNAAHKGVKYWYKFRNEIVFDGTPFTVTFNIRDKGKNQYEYLIDFKQNKTPGLSNTVYKDLLRADQVSNNKITQKESVVNTYSMQESKNNSEKFSDRDYSYDALVSKPDMKITAVNDNLKYLPSSATRKNVVDQAIKKAALLGRKNENGNIVIHVDDINTDVVLSKNSLAHGLDRRLEISAPVILNIGSVLKNAIRVNELTPKKQTANGSYVLIGYAESINYAYPVRMVVNQYTNEIDTIDILYAVNTKKETVGKMPGSHGKTALPTVSTISISNLLDYVNKYFSDVLSEDVLKRYGYDERPQGELGESALFSDRDYSAITNRSLLANALESAAINENEREWLRRYKAQLDSLNKDQQKLDEINAEIREITFTQGTDRSKLTALNNNKKTLVGRIERSDKKLLQFQAVEPLRDILEREKQKAVKRQKQKDAEILKEYKEKSLAKIEETRRQYQESRKRNVEGRQKTELKNKIKKTVKKLNHLLIHGSKEHNVKLELQDTVRNAILTADRLFDKDGGENIGECLLALDDAYRSLASSTSPIVKKAYNKEFADKIFEVRQKVDNSPISELSKETLRLVYDCYKMIYTTVTNANKIHKEGRALEVSTYSWNTINELKETGREYNSNHSKIVGKTIDTIDNFSWAELKPVFAFERLGSKTLMGLYWDAVRADGICARSIDDSATFMNEQKKKFGYVNWDLNKTKTFILEDGKEFKLTLSDIMSIYAYSKREQAIDHILKGGFMFTKGRTFVEKEDGKKKAFSVEKLQNTYETYRLNIDIISQIVGTLSEEQRKYVEAMQEYLSTVMAEKGNEVSRIMYGIDLFKEKHYFPLKSSTDFLNSVQEALQNTPTQTSLVNIGMAKETVPHASNPIMLESFEEVWKNHVVKMSQYNAFVIPIDNLQKIFNFERMTEDGLISVKNTMNRVFGENAAKYLDNWIIDLNGGMNIPGYKNPLMKQFATFKKVKTAASLSTAIQQYSAVVRATAMVDSKYFISPKRLGKTVKIPELYEEMRKYAPVTIVKEIGGFDIGSSGSAMDYMSFGEYDTFKSKVKGFFTDKGYTKKAADDMFMAASAAMDKLGWMTIWSAVKNEIAYETKIPVGSKEFFDACSKRFTEVISYTQVYDSVVSRSGIMRSKSDANKFATAFMGEPTTSINMLYNAALQFMRAKKGSKFKAFKNFTRVSRAVYSSIIFAALSSALIYSLWDDEDEDESLVEKWAWEFSGKLSDEINPLNMLPYARDIISIFQGYTIERPDMSLVADAIDTIKDVEEAITSEQEKIPAAIMDLTQQVSALYGIPLGNIVRDIKGIINGVKMITDDIAPSQVGYAFASGWKGEENSLKNKAIAAFESGDYSKCKENVTAIIALKVDEDTTEKQAQSAVRTSFTSTFKAKYLEAFNKKDYDEANRIRKLLYATGLYGTLSELDATLKKWITEQ